MAPIPRLLQNSYQRAPEYPRNLIERDSFEYNLRNDSESLERKSDKLFAPEAELDEVDAVDVTETCEDGLSAFDDMSFSWQPNADKLTLPGYNTDAITSTNHLTRKLMPHGYEQATADPSMRFLYAHVLKL